MRKKELKLVKVKITGININNYIKRDFLESFFNETIDFKVIS